MSKLFSGKRYFLKPIKQPSTNETYQSMQDILDLYNKNQPGISNNFSSFNKNNITVDYPKHYSPSFRSPVSLPPISGKNRRSNNSQKKPITKKLGNSNSSTNLYSQSLFGPGAKKQLEREKTQINVIENNLGQNKNNLDTLNQIDKLNNGKNLNNITQINNITNINIHIYQGNTNKENDINKDNIIQKNETVIPEANSFANNNIINDTMSTIQNPIFKGKQNKLNNGSSSLIGNAGMSIISPNLNNLNNTNIKKNNINNIFTKNEKNKKAIKGNIKVIPSNSSSIYTNKSISNSLSSIGSMIINTNNSNNNIKIPSSRGFSQNKSNNTNKYAIANSLPDINMGRSVSTNKKINNIDNDLINILKDENNSIKGNDLENIDLSMNFLKDLSSNNTTFVAFLQLIQTHMDIELLLDSTDNNGNNLFRRKAINTINSDKIYKLNNLLNNYFNILSAIYLKNNNNKIAPIDNFFLYQSINVIFHKCIKIQICLFCAILVTISQLATFEINTMIKNHFHQIIKEISNPLLTIFETFIKEEINLNYPELITINLRPDFNDHYNKLHKIKNLHKIIRIVN